MLLHAGRYCIGFGLVLLLGPLLVPETAFAQAVPRVILISIDGIRNSEGFGDPDCWGQPGGDGVCYIPNLFPLKSQGTLYSSGPHMPAQTSTFVNNLATWTTPGHETLFTGVRAAGENRGSQGDMRPFRPTIMERLRKQLGLTEDEVAMVVSKYNVSQLDWSLDPVHGPQVKAKMHFVGDEGDHPTDSKKDDNVAITGQCLMRGLKPGPDFDACTGTPVTPPRLLVLHFGGVDNAGHGGNWVPYTGAISFVDQQIFEKVWCELGPTPAPNCPPGSGTNPDFTRANTTLLMTTDHGRKADDFQNHETLNWADRAIFLLAIGPGIKVNELITAYFRQHEDVVPTIGQILGVETREAEGVVMRELFVGQTPSFPLQRGEGRVMVADGYFHVVWSQRNQTTGDREIWYQRVDPLTVPLGFVIPAPAPNPAPVQLSADQDEAGNLLTHTQPALFARGPRVYVAWHATKSPRQGGDNLTHIHFRQSTSGGLSWDPVEVVAPSQPQFATAPETFYFGATTVLEQTFLGQRRVWVVTSLFKHQLLGFYKAPGGQWNTSNPVLIAESTSCVASSNPDEPDTCQTYRATFAQQLRAAAQGVNIELTWQGQGSELRWEVYRASHGNFQTPATGWTVQQVSAVDDALQSHLPAVERQGNTVNILWAENREVIPCSPPPCDPQPIWKVYGSLAGTSPISGSQAFLPSVVAKSASTVYAVYSRVNPSTQDYDIFWNKSNDGGQLWLGEQALLVTPNAPSLYPSVTYDDQHQQVWAVWREWNGVLSDWEIRGKLVIAE